MCGDCIKQEGVLVDVKEAKVKLKGPWCYRKKKKKFWLMGHHVQLGWYLQCVTQLVESARV
jgi:hypothetical protein